MNKKVMIPSEMHWSGIPLNVDHDVIVETQLTDNIHTRQNIVLCSGSRVGWGGVLMHDNVE